MTTRRLGPSDVAWLALAAGIIAYEVTARDGELMSEAVDRYLRAHPWLTRAVIAATACHLANAYPAWADPYAWTFTIARRQRGGVTLHWGQ